MNDDVLIHPTAIISKSARIAKNVRIGAYTIIGDQVEIGENSIIAPHVVINGPTKIGTHNHIFQFASIGETPQDKKFSGEETHLIIGDHNIIRESVTINRGTGSGGGVTRIGSHNLIMAYVHIAHDCQIGNHIVFSNNASLAGHVHVEDYVNLGGFVGIFQFCTIGTRAFLAGGSMVIKDVPPYIMVHGYPARVYGLNKVGLQRAGFTNEELSLLRRAYKILYRQGLKLEEAVAEMKALPTTPSLTEFINFIEQHRERGITR